MGSNTKIAIVGPLLGKHKGMATSQGEILGISLREDGYEVLFISEKIQKIPRFFDTIYQLIFKASKYDLIILQGYGFYHKYIELLTYLISKALNKKVIYTMHGGGLFQEYITSRIYKYLFKRIEIITTPSNYFHSRFLEVGVSSVVVYNQINKFDYNSKVREKIRPNLLWMRTFEKSYNPLMAVKAVLELKNEIPEIKLYMGGVDFGHLKEVKDFVLVNNLNSNIEFIGYMDLKEKNRRGNECDLYLCTNTYDNTPVSLIEMMAMGCIVVSTSVGGIPFLIENEKNGFLVPNDDSSSMALKIKQLIWGEIDVRKISENSIETASKFDWETSVSNKWKYLINNIK
jgi:glycosyltransferase involved in cell wall biosynthesis